MIDPDLPEVLVGRLGRREKVFRSASAERPSVGVWKQRVEVRGDRGVDRDGSSRQDAHTRVVVRNRRHAGDAEPLDERLERPEVERLVLCDRPADHRAELMPVEIRNRLVGRIEEVLRIQRRVAIELECRSAHGIGAGPRDGIDHATGGPAELRRVCVRQDLEFEDGLHAEQHAGGRAGRLVVNIVDVGAIEQEAALLRPGAVDRNLRRPAADHVVAGGERRRDARLQQRQLLERPSVQRQLTNLFVANQSAHRSRRRVDDRRFANDRQLLADPPQLQFHVHDRVLSDGKLDAPTGDGLKSGQRHVDFIFARRQHGYAVMSGSVGLQLPDGARRRVEDHNVGVGQGRTARVGDDALQARADGLCGCSRGTEKKRDEDAGAEATDGSLDHGRAPSRRGTVQRTRPETLTPVEASVKQGGGSGGPTCRPGGRRAGRPANTGGAAPERPTANRASQCRSSSRPCAARRTSASAPRRFSNRGCRSVRRPE